MKISIRLKLTLWYSMMMVISLSTYLVLTTTTAQRQYHRNPDEIFEELNQRYPDLILEKLTSGGQLRREDLNTYINQIRQEDLRNAQITSLSILGILVLLSFAGGYVISGRMLSPLRKVNSATKTISADNLHINIEGVQTDDELGELIENFNAMTTRLHTSFDLQKQFIENASHELKTPLTISQTNLEAILQDARMNPEELRDNVQRAVKSISFMNTLIEDLLLLSLTKEHITTEAVVLNELVSDSAAQLMPLAKKRDISIIVNTPEKNVPDTVHVNRTLLQRAIMNCLENAIKYAAHTITITIEDTYSKVRVSIHDDGEGIPAENVQHVWERFYRVDSARARRDGGTGLGLAITKAVIELHGGSVGIQSNSKTGTTVQLELPS